MNIRRFIMEDWLAACKDTCRHNLGESGMPDLTVGEYLARCGLAPDSLTGIVLKDHDTRGTERLRAAILGTYGPPVAFEHLTVTTGTSEALFILFNILNEDRTAVTVPFPSFQSLYEIPRALGLETRFYSLKSENGWRPDPDEICALIDDRTRVVVVNSPHNPSGVIFPIDAMDAVVRKAAFHGAMVLADEHYRFLPLDTPAPIRSFARPDGNVIAFGSLTKCFGAIGLRVGWIAAPETVVARVRDFRDYLTHTLSPVSDFLSAAALERFRAFADPAIETLRMNRAALADAVRRVPGLSLVPPEGGVTAFPSYEYPVPSDMFARGLIERFSVFVLPGSAFETEGHVRINFGGDPVSFREALRLLEMYCSDMVL